MNRSLPSSSPLSKQGFAAVKQIRAAQRGWSARASRSWGSTSPTSENSGQEEREPQTPLELGSKLIWALATFPRFLTFVTTQDRDGTLRPFPHEWEYLRRIATAIDSHRLVIILKSRQMLLSWMLAARAVYRAIREPVLVLMVSKGEREAFELKDRAKVVYDHLPWWMQQGIRAETKGLMHFEGGGRILCLPSSPGIGKSYTAAELLLDEAAELPDGPAMWTGLRPTLDAGGRAVIWSTPKGHDPFFAQQWFAQPQVLHREIAYWREHPERDEAWAVEARKGMTEEQWEENYELKFDAYSGSVFAEFGEMHVVPPFEIPWAWPRIVGLDHGLQGFAAVLEVRAPDGGSYFAREYLGANIDLGGNVRAIRALMADAPVDAWPIDPSAAGRDIRTKLTLLHELRTTYGLPVVQANNAVDVGLSRMKAGFAAARDPRKPGLRVFASCPGLIADLRTTTWEQVRKGHKPHRLDAARYAHLHDNVATVRLPLQDGPRLLDLPPGLVERHLDPMSASMRHAQWLRAHPPEFEEDEDTEGMEVAWMSLTA